MSYLIVRKKDSMVVCCFCRFIREIKKSPKSEKERVAPTLDLARGPLGHPLGPGSRKGFPEVAHPPTRGGEPARTSHGRSIGGQGTGYSWAQPLYKCQSCSKQDVQTYRETLDSSSQAKYLRSKAEHRHNALEYTPSYAYRNKQKKKKKTDKIFIGWRLALEKSTEPISKKSAKLVQ